MVQTALLLLFVVGILAAALIPGQLTEIEALRAAIDQRAAGELMNEADLGRFRRSIESLATGSDAGAELVDLGRSGGAAMGEERYRLRAAAPYHEIGGLLARLEALPYASRLSDLRLRRGAGGEAHLDLTLHAPFLAEGGS